MLLSINEINHTLDAYDDSTQKLASSISMSTSSLNIAKKLFEDTSKTYSRKTLLASGWPNKPIGTNSLNVSIMKLRRKLEMIDSRIEIKSYPSLGYRLILPRGVEAIHPKFNSEHNLSSFLKAMRQEEVILHRSCSSTVKSKTLPLRWGDLFISTVILLYSGALYYSLY